MLEWLRSALARLYKAGPAPSTSKVQSVAFRNPVRLPDGRIDIEIKHPHYGWGPFTASPADIEAHGRAIFAQVDGHLKAQGAGK
jgi:hypothetical protein